MYAILDIETTGGKFTEEGITEIAIYRFDGHQVTDKLTTLLNPEKPIQEFVVQLTGINDKMLKNAPKFHEIAKRIIEITEDAVFVAHNTSFDYRVVKEEFKRLGYDYKRNTLCTVELSKKLIINQPSYSLGKLCKNIGIPISNRHRADGDAFATVQLFKLLLEKDTKKEIVEQTIKYADNRNVNKQKADILETLPEKHGVYFIHNSQGNIIFIGKGNNIRLEVNKLFLKESTKAIKINKKMATISYELTGNKLFSRLKYHIELEIIKPRFNIIRRNRKAVKNFANENLIIIDKGRTPEEHAVILIENNCVFGYGYTTLAFQEENLTILKSILTPITNKILAKKIIKTYIDNNRVKKIVRL